MPENLPPNALRLETGKTRCELRTATLRRVLLIVSSFLFLNSFQTDSRFNGPDPPQLWFSFGDTTGNESAFFGWSLTGVGDQNNDGYDDILIADNNAQRVFMYFGGSPMDSIEDLVFGQNEEFFRVANLDDINGDSIVDFAIVDVVGTYVYLGGSGKTVSYTLPGIRCQGAGDVNNDGFDDILISDYSWNDYQGMVSLYFGGDSMDTIADWIVSGDSARYWFGWSISGNGDLNHDDYGDIAVSGFRSLQSGGPSYAKVYFGGEAIDTVADVVVDEYDLPLISDLVWILNDLDDDGDDEFAVISGADTGLYVFKGGIAVDNAPDLVLRGSGFSSPAELRIASLGDVNGDGYNDLLSGNPEAWNRLGEVLLYLGHPSMNGEFDVGWTGFLSPWDGAGQAVGWCGDVNNDGLNDIIFSCYDPFSPNRTGRVDIFGGDTSLVVNVKQIEADDPIPREFELVQNYPNPFNSSTIIRFTVSRSSILTVLVFDMQGRLVMELLDRKDYEPGEYSIPWNGTDRSGRKVSTGVYFCTLSSSTGILTKKMTLLR